MGVQSVNSIIYTPSSVRTNAKQAVTDAVASESVMPQTSRSVFRYTPAMDGQVSYDQPDPRQSKALLAYKNVAFQEKRSQIESMVNVDLYA
jgi:hypothetical protein